MWTVLKQNQFGKYAAILLLFEDGTVAESRDVIDAEWPAVPGRLLLLTDVQSNPICLTLVIRASIVFTVECRFMSLLYLLSCLLCLL